MESDKIKILVIEDNPTDFFLLKELIKLLKLPLEIIEIADTIAKALAFLQKNEYDLIFLDLTLPDSSGLNSFTKVNLASPHIPIVVLSSITDGDLALEIVKRGAQDYLIKGEINPYLLEKSIRYSIERKKNLDTIRQSETHYKYLFENNPIPMWAFDIETKRFLIVNQAAVAHYGYSEEEFLSMTLYDIRPEAEREKLTLNISQEHGLSKKREWIHRKKNGEIIFTDIVGHDITINNRRARLILSYDVTERKRAQQDVLFQANILQNITNVVVVTDFEGIINYWNKGAVKLLGYDPQEVRGKHIRLLKHGRDALTLNSVLKKVAETKTYTTEVQVLTKAQATIWLSLKVTCLEDMVHENQGLLWIANDITEERQNKERLLIQKSAIEAVGVGIIITDPLQKDNPIVVVNPKFEDLTGYKAKEIIGKNCRILQGENTDQETVAEIARCIKDQKAFDGEILNYRQNGDPFWNKLMINPIFNEEGKLINFVGFQQDVTDAKNVKEDLLYKNRELNTFIYKASHDLRSPIASLIGLINFAQHETVDEKILPYLNMMEEASERLDQILKTLIDMISFKQAEPQIEQVNFADLISETIENVPGKEDLEKFELSLDFDKTANLHTDKKILSHILLQLIENAIKFRDAKKDHLKLEISFLHFPGKNHILVKDNGLGISKEFKNKVFDMFFRANETRPGSGLGLYIVKNFVEKLQGRLFIQSDLGTGTAVTIELPEKVMEMEA